MRKMTRTEPTDTVAAVVSGWTGVRLVCGALSVVFTKRLCPGVVDWVRIEDGGATTSSVNEKR